MLSKIAGSLKQDDHFEEWWESDPIQIGYFNDVSLKVIFTDAAFEDYMMEADNALEKFLRLTVSDREKDSHLVYQYYLQTIEFLGAPKLDLSTENDIWDFVRPNEIIIEWPAGRSPYILVSCGCAWEEEHGLQLVFKEGKLTRASEHDGHDED